MKEGSDRQSGQVLIELAFLLPILALLLLGVIEVSGAINAYMTVHEASRSGARLASIEKKTTNVEAHVRSIMERLPESNLTISTSQGTDASGIKIYTVEVQYEYKSILNDPPLVGKLMPRPLILRADTAMPSP
jgi:Flp pilus assembly protein TadG